ncbi:phosphoribosylformylglycinamidine synthase subunit PurS [Sneathiella sp. CAU 1612]|jgi:phosphoribosylformylglycinamidine synthase|uniref:Phosphoribosylformylglycinamidine synthase subunit PurS n=1 Tax=Sneathiella sedimenti TaxID=2816034 RepID=A0ABS3F972_9PROT|nr:phosphoribosylformylglycinamidine synthase subunit PurS [Sneathiella sedimenti]MBO0334877.1 phosphoribosylformylglycinamidine synthase subunit PurS [Sneathiella sedimenti]
MKARVYISLKNGVLDPQGKAISHSLQGLGFNSVLDARQGKTIDLDLADMDRDAAAAEVEKMCQQLLANTVIENYSIEMLD